MRRVCQRKSLSTGINTCFNKDILRQGYSFYTFFCHEAEQLMTALLTEQI